MSAQDMNDDRPKRDTMSHEEATISNMWEIAEAQRLARKEKPKGE